MYTKEEADKKWCPFARVFTGSADYVCAANRNLLERDKGLNTCSPYNCMAWREDLEDANKGYCGLAGNP